MFNLNMKGLDSPVINVIMFVQTYQILKDIRDLIMNVSYIPVINVIIQLRCWIILRSTKNPNTMESDIHVIFVIMLRPGHVP